MIKRTSHIYELNQKVQQSNRVFADGFHGMIGASKSMPCRATAAVVSRAAREFGISRVNPGFRRRQ